MRKICYGCISGGYDLPKPFVKTEGWEYILFTDTEIPENLQHGWNVVVVQDLDLDSTRFSRYHKHNPHKVLRAFSQDKNDISVWVDGNLTINANLDSILNQLGDFEFVSLNHPHRDCIYKEASECIKQSKDSSDIISSQVEQYSKEGFPEDFGMLQSGILFRKHNQENIIDFQSQWWNEIVTKSKRDQLSFNYIKWKNEGLINHEMLNSQQLLFDSRFFPIQQHKHGW